MKVTDTLLLRAMITSMYQSTKLSNQDASICSRTLMFINSCVHKDSQGFLNQQVMSDADSSHDTMKSITITRD